MTLIPRGRRGFESGHAHICHAASQPVFIFRDLGLYYSTPTLVPYMARASHLPGLGAALKLFLSSTWGRADQQTPRGLKSSPRRFVLCPNFAFSLVALRFFTAIRSIPISWLFAVPSRVCYPLVFRW